MKNLLMLSFLISLVCSPIFGQYRINKLNYNAHKYVYQPGDRYDPTLAGVASFLVPGLGQVLAGETGRGLLFFAGSVVSSALTISSLSKNTVLISDGYYSETRKTSGSTYIGLIASAGIWIWSIVDAVKVAKVNNLAYRDKNKVGLHNFSPVLIQNPNNGQLTGGLSFKFRLD